MIRLDAEHTQKSAQNIVLKNTLMAVAGQFLAMPLSLLINVAAARYLGATQYGQLFLATTFVSFAFVFVDWGQRISLTGAIARNRGQTGLLLVTGIALRMILAPVFFACMIAVSVFLGYPNSFRWLLFLVTLATLASSASGAMQDTLQAFERGDLNLKATAAGQVIAGGVVLAALTLGGGLDAFVLAQGVGAVLATFILAWVIRKLGIRDFRVRWDMLRQLAVQGTPFLAFGLVLVLQPTLDAYFLSQLVPPEVVGWNAVARKLIGVLIYPASALVGALYPTICRLHAHEPERVAPTVSGAVRLAMLVGIAAGLGCMLYPELGVSVFGMQDYAHTCENLRVLGLFVILVYVSMPISSTLMALGYQRVWSVVQFACIIFSAVLDPWLVPWFQTHYANGGIGVCVASVISELAMVAMGLVLLPKGLLQPALLRTLFTVCAASAVTGGIAFALKGLNPWLAAPCAMASCVGLLWLSGEVHKTQLMRRGAQ